MMNIINGRPMTIIETTDFLSKLTNSPDYKKISKLIDTEYSKFSLENLKIKATFVSDLYTTNKKLNVGKMIYFISEDKKLVFHAFGYNEIDSTEVTYSLGVDILEGNELKQLDVKKGSTHVTNSPYDGVDLDVDVETPPFHDETYTPGETNSKITTAWDPTEFCAPGGYQHCGKNCGYNMARGGGAPINELDECCVAHDRCWENFGEGNCECDGILENCARRYRTKYYIIANAIIIYFDGC
ncbi:hypothetical protein [Paenibacillus maysiensis]|uniref:hypothetical protein n=1 Tax=Paenibacillus maysiensis TaxID=1155954 RepID=UPI000471001C|nr:hypothetical protein [Paenibacillus maysiensis]